VPSIAPVPTNALLYSCIDGWHRLAAIKALVPAEPDGVFDPLWPQENMRPVPADDSSSIFSDWPRDVETGRVARVPVTVLQGAYSVLHFRMGVVVLLAPTET
jgi:hypothetical protein